MSRFARLDCYISRRKEGGISMTQEDIYQENYPIVYGYLLSLCGDIPLAEDLAAETFFQAFLQDSHNFEQVSPQARKLRSYQDIAFF